MPQSFGSWSQSHGQIGGPAQSPDESDKKPAERIVSSIRRSARILNQWRINSWKDKVSPEGYAFPGNPLNREKAQPVAGLSELGKKLLGLEKWKNNKAF